MTRRAKQVRLYAVGIVFAAIIVTLWARLVQVQYVRKYHYRDLAREQMVFMEKIPPVRGCIFDRHGRPLALSVAWVTTMGRKRLGSSA